MLEYDDHQHCSEREIYATQCLAYSQILSQSNLQVAKLSLAIASDRCLRVHESHGHRRGDVRGYALAVGVEPVI